MFIAYSCHYLFHTDHFLEFGKCLRKEGVVLQKILQEAMGRYDRALQHLMVDVLRETENPVDNLVQALEKMALTDGSQRAAEAIQRGTNIS